MLFCTRLVEVLTIYWVLNFVTKFWWKIAMEIGSASWKRKWLNWLESNTRKEESDKKEKLRNYIRTRQGCEKKDRVSKVEEIN